MNLPPTPNGLHSFLYDHKDFLSWLRCLMSGLAWRKLGILLGPAVRKGKDFPSLETG